MSAFFMPESLFYFTYKFQVLKINFIESEPDLGLTGSYLNGV